MHVAVRDRSVAPLVDVDETRLQPVVRHPVRSVRLDCRPSKRLLASRGCSTSCSAVATSSTEPAAPASAPTSVSATDASSRSARSTRTRPRTIDVDGLVDRARIRRHPHALRRAGPLGSDVHAVAAARRDHRRGRELRVHDRAARRHGRRRLRDADDGPGRGHVDRRAARRAGVGMADVRRVARPDRRPARRQRGLPRRSLHDAPAS